MTEKARTTKKPESRPALEADLDSLLAGESVLVKLLKKAGFTSPEGVQKATGQVTMDEDLLESVQPVVRPLGGFEPKYVGIKRGVSPAIRKDAPLLPIELAAVAI